MFRKLSACPAGGCVLALPSAVGWIAEHECGSAVSMPSTPRPSAVDADMRRQHLNAEPLWPSLLTHDPQPSGRDTTLAPLQEGADVATLSATPRREMASASKAAPRHTRHDSLCAESGPTSSRSRARMPPHLGAAPRPGLGRKRCQRGCMRSPCCHYRFKVSALDKAANALRFLGSTRQSETQPWSATVSAGRNDARWAPH